MPPHPDNSVATVATNKQERRKRERKCMAATSDGRTSPAPAGVCSGCVRKPVIATIVQKSKHFQTDFLYLLAIQNQGCSIVLRQALFRTPLCVSIVIQSFLA